MTQNTENGIVLLSVLFLGLLLGIIVASFTQVAGGALQSTRMWRESDEAFLIALSAMDNAKYDIYARFADHFHAAPLPQSSGKFDWFETYTSASVGTDNAYVAPRGASYDDGTVTVTIEDSTRVDKVIVDLLLTVEAEKGDHTRTVQELVRYQLASSRVFDYAYFVNNFGWFWGSSITAHGDVRANGNFNCRYGPDINGDAYAATNPAFGASGDVQGSWDYWSMGRYYNNAPGQARPGDPPSSTFGDNWPMGYDTDVRQREHVPILPMPYLGDLSWYTYLANKENGTLSQGGKKLVNGVYEGDGPDGVRGTPDDGMLVLVGTEDDPIEIDGPVVISNDVVIKGKITGQGSIYAGRNIHIAGRVEYVAPPNWPKPDDDPMETVEDNQESDMLGLAAKGNIIFGDYTSRSWRYTTFRYIRPGFTSSYETDPSDYSLGYDSDRNPSNGYRFNGDYTAEDGGQKLDYRGRVRDRHYYESSNDEAFRAIHPTSDVEKIDAVCYTNHLFGGDVDEMDFNGAIVARDEAIIFNYYVNMTWDIRLGSPLYDSARINFALPQTLNVPISRYWREL